MKSTYEIRIVLAHNGTGQAVYRWEIWSPKPRSVCVCSSHFDFPSEGRARANVRTLKKAFLTERVV